MSFYQVTGHSLSQNRRWAWTGPVGERAIPSRGMDAENVRDDVSSVPRRAQYRFSKECEWTGPASPHQPVASMNSAPLVAMLEPGESELPSDKIPDYNFGKGLLGLKDMRLLHHWSTVTYSTLDIRASPEVNRMQQTTVVQLGFDHAFVLRGVLSIAALHLAFLNSANPADSNTFLLQAAAHQNLAITDFHVVLANMDEKNCIAAFTFATLTIIYGFAFAGLERANNTISAMVNTVSLVRGINTVLTPYLAVIAQSELGMIMTGRRNPAATGQIPELTRLKHLVTINANQDSPATVNALVESIETLHVAALESLPPDIEGRLDLPSLMSWPTTMSLTFSTLVADRNQFALIALAHFAGLISLSDEVWWLQNFQPALVTAIKPLLDPGYHDFLLWPQNASIGLECFR
ncbi:uncharacterized protein PAC_19430 [Phialocephala subalpina]|uniref:Uncharacterized protein n=1 Tax=Phialocephala subalpina TaxID=576137 RepID=A0A1L7XX05_9HELO|nr:uncharacterized protein PAC_19430 [Phialocephala subalpina]